MTHDEDLVSKMTAAHLATLEHVDDLVVLVFERSKTPMEALLLAVSIIPAVVGHLATAIPGPYAEYSELAVKVLQQMLRLYGTAPNEPQRH